MLCGPPAAAFGMAERFLTNSSVSASHSAADFWCLRWYLLLLLEVMVPSPIESEATGPGSAAQATSRHRTMQVLRPAIVSPQRLRSAPFCTAGGWRRWQGAAAAMSRTFSGTTNALCSIYVFTMTTSYQNPLHDALGVACWASVHDIMLQATALLSV